MLGSQQVETDPRRDRRRRVRHLVRQGPRRRPRRRCAQARQCLRFLAAWRRAGGGRRRPWLHVVLDAASERPRHAWRGACRSLNPANLAEYLEFGHYGWALSRFSGIWVGLQGDLGDGREQLDGRSATRSATSVSRLRLRRTACIIAGPTCRSLQIESRLEAKLAAVLAFAAANPIDRLIVPVRRAPLSASSPPARRISICWRRCGCSDSTRRPAPPLGVRIYKVGIAWPLEPQRRAAHSCAECGKSWSSKRSAASSRASSRNMLYNCPGHRPAVVGKHDEQGAPLLSVLGELRPSRVAPVVADWLARSSPGAGSAALAAAT